MGWKRKYGLDLQHKRMERRTINFCLSVRFQAWLSFLLVMILLYKQQISIQRHERQAVVWSLQLDTHRENSSNLSKPTNQLGTSSSQTGELVKLKERTPAANFVKCLNCSQWDGVQLDQPYLGYETPGSKPPNCEKIHRSLKFDKSCREVGKPGEPLQLLVTGTGRSGTEFLQKYLTILGLEVAHDTYGPSKHGAVAWPLAFSNSKFVVKTKDASVRYCRHPFRWRSHRRFKQVVHLVRNPLKSIISRFDKGKYLPDGGIAKVTKCNCNVKKGLPKKLGAKDLSLVLALRHWVLWNSFVQHTASWGMRIEDFSEDPYQFLPRLMNNATKVNHDKRLKKANQVSSSTNSKHTRKDETISWKYLETLDPEFTTMCQIMAIRYGYKIEANDLTKVLQDEYCERVDLGFRCRVVEIPNLNCGFFDAERHWECTLDPIISEKAYSKEESERNSQQEDGYDENEEN